MAPRPKNPPPDRREQILDAALKVFGTKGFTDATNADIAREAGVTAAALYYYFPSKEDLFHAVIAARIDDALTPVLRTAGPQVDTSQLSPEQMLPFLVQNMVRFFMDQRTQLAMRILLAEGPRNPEMAGMWAGQIMGKAIGPLLGWAQNMMAQGKLRSMDPRMVLIMLNGPIFATMILRDLLKFPPLQDLSNESLTRHLTEMILAALPADPTDSPKE